MNSSDSLRSPDGCRQPGPAGNISTDASCDTAFHVDVMATLKDHVRFSFLRSANDNEQTLLQSADKADSNDHDLSRNFDPDSHVDDFALTQRRLSSFFNSFDNGSAVVFVHGSFARGLATSTSDLNLYVAPYTRLELDSLWEQSPWRYGLTDCMESSCEQGTIEVALERWLQRPVTISCKDDPRVWIKQEPMVMAFPWYEDPLPQRTTFGETAYLEHQLRKCWYEVSWMSICRNDPTLSSTGADCLSKNTVASDSISHGREIDAMRTLLLSTIQKLNSILQSASTDDWELILPEFPSIHSFRQGISKLAQEIAGMTENGQDRGWRELEKRYRSCTVGILNLEELVRSDLCR